MDLRDHIRVIPDFPKPGINFYDIASLIAHPAAWREAIGRLRVMAEAYRPDMLMGIESRGFLVAAPLALEMGCGFGMVRKKGKLPGRVLRHRYDLEYGQDEIEVQPDLLPPGGKILLVDDLLATGGTMAAAESLITQAGAVVAGNLCIVELEGLDGRGRLVAPLESLVRCPA